MEKIQNLMNSLGIKNVGEKGNEIYSQVKEEIERMLSNLGNKDNQDIINQIKEQIENIIPSNMNINNMNDNINDMTKQLQDWIQQHVSSFDSNKCKQEIENHGFVFEQNIMNDDLEDHFVFVFKKQSSSR